MKTDNSSPPSRRGSGGARILPYALCLLINLAGAALLRRTGFLLFSDLAGTVIAAALGGYIPGAALGLLTALIRGIGDFNYVYYAAVNVLTALFAAFLADKDRLRRFSGAVLFLICVSLFSAALRAALDRFLLSPASEPGASAFAQSIAESASLPLSSAAFAADLITSLASSAICAAVALAVVFLLPAGRKGNLRFIGWQQTPLSRESMREAGSLNIRGVSLRAKLLLLVVIASVCIAVAATVVSMLLYRRFSIEEHTQLGTGAAGLAASIIDAERVDEFIELGETADGYLETEKMLAEIRSGIPDIEYVYVYKIMEDGCHVVFDLDTDDVPGSEPGEVIPFDESFLPYLLDLLAGRGIEPIISDDSYGWLLTAYHPVYDSSGVCRCYAAADISMNRLASDEHSFIIRELLLFLGFFILILAVALWLVRYNIIFPVNAMAIAAGAFAFNSEEARADSVERIKALDIHTGDEIENLYHAFAKTSEESMQYVAEVRKKTETITRMQNGLILVLAELVESRDECTGDHVRKTASYARIIMDELRREGKYTSQLTDEFVDSVINSAPLHDIGKIKVPDSVLNKPGKLDDNEFSTMKKHTTVGREIIDQAISIVPEPGYLDEAKNLAGYHHERWDGSGYPSGLAAEEIPLSARIMAVADVFDALVSRRSYKDGFPFDVAMDIIRDGVGSHFDPVVAQAFINASDEVRRVAESFADGRSN